MSPDFLRILPVVLMLLSWAPASQAQMNKDIRRYVGTWKGTIDEASPFELQVSIEKQGVDQAVFQISKSKVLFEESIQWKRNLRIKSGSGVAFH